MPDDASQHATGTDPTIEELAKKLGVKAWQLAGLKAAHGWGAGKRLPEAEFQEKLSAWLSGPTARGGGV